MNHETNACNKIYIREAWRQEQDMKVVLGTQTDTTLLKQLGKATLPRSNLLSIFSPVKRYLYLLIKKLKLWLKFNLNCIYVALN